MRSNTTLSGFIFQPKFNKIAKTAFIVSSKGKNISLLLAMILFFSLNSNAQILPATYNVPGDYTDLASAIADINLQGVSGNVTINVIAGNPQTAPAGGYVIGGTGSNILITGTFPTSSTAQVIIQGNGNTVTASASLTAGNLNDAIFKLVGADWITLTGFTMQESGATPVLTAATNNMTEWGVALLQVSATDGAQNNTILGNTISLNRSYQNSFGIYSNVRHIDGPTSANVTTLADITNNTTAPNSNNRVYGNNISNVNEGIVFIGSPTAANMDNANEIGLSGTGNSLTNYGGLGAATAYVGFPTTIVAGAYLNDQTNFNLSFNSFITTLNTATALRGILTDYVAVPIGTITNNCNSNTVTFSQGGAGGLQAITSASTAGTISNVTQNLNSNKVINNAITGAASAVTIFCVANLGAYGTVSMSNNEIRGNTSTATTGGFIGVTNQGAVVNTINILNNDIGTETVNAVTFSVATTAGITGVSNTLGTATTTLNINGNFFRRFSMVSSGQLAMIINSGAAVGVALNFNNNHIGTSTADAYSYSAASTGNFFGIVNAAGAATASLSITGNDITRIVQPVTGSGGLNYINNQVFTGATAINSNTFTNLTANSTAATTLISNSVSHAANTVHTCNNNSIVTGFNRISASGALQLFLSNAVSPATVTETATGNNFSNITITGTSTISPWQNSDGGTPVTNVTNNTFSNINGSGSTGAIVILNVSNSSNGTCTGNIISNVTGGGNITGLLTTGGTITTISGNTIAGLTSSGASSTILGLSITGGTTVNNLGNKISGLASTGTTSPIVRGVSVTGGTTVTISKDTIFSLSASGTSSPVVNGILVSSGTTVALTGNKIYDLSVSGAISTTSPAITGILMSGGTTVNTSNNYIGSLNAPAANLTDAIRGISVTSSTGSSSYNVYYNTVNLSASSSGANFGSTGIFHTVSSTATTAKLDLRNNIIVNTSAPVGTGLTVAFRRSAGAAGNLANYASSSNNNDFYAGTPGAANLIYSDGTSSALTFAAYTAGVFTAGTIAPRDANSFTENPTWMSTTTTVPTYLHINTTTSTLIESGGNSSGLSANFPTDYDNDIRQGSAGYTGGGTNPDVGADEFEGITPAPVITVISITPPATPQCSVAARAVSVNVTTLSGSITGVTITFAFNGTSQGTFPMTNTSGTIWDYTIPAATPFNATVTWSITASSDVPLTTIYTGASYADAPLTGVTATASASVSPICFGSSSNLSVSLTTGPIPAAPAATSYCQSTHTSGCSGDDVIQVVLNTLNSTASACGLTGSTPPRYLYNTTSTTTLSPAGGSYNLAVTFGTDANQYFGAWMDYNHDGNYSTNEYLGGNTINAGTSGTATISFSVPSSAYNGVTHMRIIGGNDVALTNTGTTPACGASSSPWGETQDFDITITGALSAVPYGGAVTAYSWNDGSGVVGTTNPLTVSPTTTTGYTVTATSANCPITASTSVTVIPQAPAPTPHNSFQCGTGVPTANVTTSNPGTPVFKWYNGPGSGATLLQSSTSNSYTTSISVTTTFYVAEVVSGCESARAIVVANVNPPDAIQATTSTSPSCPFTNITLTATQITFTNGNSYSYVWNSTAGGGATNVPGGSGVTANAIVQATTAGSKTYTVTATDGACVTTSSVVVVISTPPNIDSIKAVPSTICQGQSSTLSIYSSGLGAGAQTPPTGYCTTGLYSSGCAAFSDYIASVTFAGVINRTSTCDAPTTGDGYSTYSSQVPTLTSGNVYPISVGTTSADVEGVTVWIDYNRDGIFSAGEAVFTPAFAGVAGVVYSGNVTISNAALAGQTKMRVRCNWNVAPPTNGACALVTWGETEDYLVNIIGLAPQDPAKTYSWAPTGGTSFNATVTPPVGTTIYTVSVNATGNACTNKATVAVNVNPIPSNPIGVGASTTCGAGSVVLTGTGAGGSNILKWWTASTGGTVAYSSSSPSSFTTPILGSTTTYYLEDSAVTGCKSNRVPVVATVTPAPVVTINNGIRPIKVCNGVGSATLTATSPNDPNYNYSWAPATGLGGTTTGATVLANPTVTTKYTVTGFDPALGCSAIDTITVFVGTSPAIGTSTASPSTFCQGGSSQLTAGISTVNYSVSSVAFGTEPCGGSAGPSGDDAVMAATAIGFNFNYYGTTYSQFTISTNGNIQLGNGTGTVGNPAYSNAWTPAVAPDPTVPNNIIGAPWADWFPAAGNITYGINGVAPNRKLVVCFNITATGSGIPGTINSQIVLYETSNKIRVNITSITGANTHWEGVENATGTLATAVPGRNATAWNTTNDSYEFSPPSPVTYSWAPSGSLNNATISNPVASPTTSTIYTVTVSDPAGCSSTSTVSVNVVVTPPAPTVTGNTICGPGNVSLTSTVSNGANTIIWTDTIGGPILNTGLTYNPYVTTSGSFYVREVPPVTANTVGYNGTSTGPVGFFPDPASYLNFTVTAPGGIRINTVDVSTNAPTTNVPLVVGLMSPTGDLIASTGTIILTAGGNTAMQTVTLNMYVPPGTWRLQPIVNNNLSVHQDGVVQSTAPWTIPGVMQITCFGNVNGSCFATNTYGLFYNWNVSTACISPTAIASYTVAPSPGLGIASSNGMNFCNVANTVLTAVDSTSSGYNVFAWSPATGLSATTGASVTVTGLVTTTTYTLTAQNTVSGCNAIATKTITINPAPTLFLSYHDTTICPIAVPSLPFNATGAKSSVVPVGNRFDPNFITGTVYGGNTTQYSQMIFTAAELNAAGLVGPTNITSLAFFVANKLTTTTYNVSINLRADASVPTDFPSTAHLTPIGAVNYSNPAIASVLGWNTYNFTTPFSWNGTSNLLVSECFTHNVAGFFDVVSTSPTTLPAPGLRFTALNASACGSATGGFLVAPSQNDRPNVRFTGGNVLFSWSPSLGLSSTTIGNPVLTTSALTNNVPVTYVVTVTDPLSGCSKTDSIKVKSSTTPLNPIMNVIGDSVFCFSGTASMTVTGTTGTFQWQTSNNGVNFTDISGANGTSFTQVISTNKYYRVYVSCGGDSIYSRIVAYVVNSPQILSTASASRCGVGTVTLGATSSAGSNIDWYSAITGGSSLGSGTSFVTPIISSTTTYYVEANINGGGSQLNGLGNTSVPTASGFNAQRGIQFNATSNFTLLSADFFADYVGTANMTVVLQNSSGTPLQTASINVVSASAGASWHTMNINFPVTVGTGYKLLCQFNSGSLSNFSHSTGADYSTAAFNNLGPVGVITNGLDFGPVISTTSYWYFYNISVLTTGCASGRVAVTATVTPPPAMAVSPVSASVCESSSVTITVDAGGQAAYQTFTWSPAAGLNQTTGTSVIATPLVTTTYTVTGNDSVNGCANIATSTITVTQRPAISSITVLPNPLCSGDSTQITVTATPVIPASGAPTVASASFATQSCPVNAGPSGDDNVMATQNIGFSFNYFGVTYTQFTISTNGNIQLGDGSGSPNNPFYSNSWTPVVAPNGAVPNNIIGAPWADWFAGAGDITWGVTGIAPNRKLIVCFNIAATGSGIPGTINSQIVLSETVNTVRVNITSLTGANTHWLGVENADGTQATVVAGRNATTWTASNESWVFSPPVSSSLTYSWAPSLGLSSTSVSNPKASPGTSTVYTVTVFETGTGCSRSQAVTITVTPKPKPYIYTLQPISGDTVILSADTVVCSNNPGFNIYVGDSGAYSGGYPPGTTFEFVGLTAPSNTDDSTFVSSDVAGLVNVTLPGFLGGCSGQVNNGTVNGGYNISFGAAQAQQIVLATDSVGCFGEPTGNAIATVIFGGTPNFRWQWFDGSYNLLRDVTTSNPYDTLAGVPTGWYYLVSTDHQGVANPPYCEVIDSIFIGEPSAPLQVDEELANHIDVQCYGYATGAIDITASGGTGGYIYQWSNGSTDEDQSGLVAGIYTVTVTDTRGCAYEFATEIIENPQVTIGTDQSNVSCHNGFDGTAIVYVDGGVPPYSYLWSNGETTEIASNLAAGVYTVIITDASGTPGCDTIMTFLITQPPLLDATATVNNLVCFGSSNGTATVFPFGGTPPYEYSWNTIPVQTTQTATGLSAGTYVNTITDSVGCTKDVVIQITQPDSLYFSKTIDDVTCNGGNDGSITISVVGGTPGYTYLWSNGQTTETASGLTAGTYVVTVTDNNGCQVIGSILVNEPDAIIIDINQVDVSCYGGSNGSASATVTGGFAPYTYSWNTNPGQTTSSATGLVAGTYTLVVSDASGCTASVDVFITEPDSIALNPNVDEPLCGNSTGTISLFITGGMPGYTVIWSNGNTTQTNSGLVSGTYTVTVTDANGCVNTQSFTISAPPAIVVTPTVTNVSCNGSTNGSITIAVSGGNPPYDYQWSNGSTDPTVTGLGAGNYTVTVYDANSCSVTTIITITEPAQLSCICNSNVTNVSCFGGSNGSITAIPQGGTAPYSYSWRRIAPTVSGVLATTQTISGLTAGTYEVTITDANGCVKVGTVVVTQPAQLFVATTVISNACNGATDGKITATVTGGVPPYSYSWNTTPTQTTSIATGLGAGTYTVVVTDANGCTKTASATITQPGAITLTTTKTNVSCNGAANGTATVTASGGISPYLYLWSNGKTTKSVTGLANGTYTVTVTDGNGCTKTTTVSITQPSKISALYVVVNPTCFGATDGSIDLTVTGGTPPYTYAWSTGATTEDLSGLGAGTYSVFITDSKGCVVLANIYLVQPNAITLSSTVKDAKCFGASDGKITVLATGGTSPYTYLWSNGTSNATASNLAAGTYTVTVTDSKGCSASTSAIVGQTAQLVCNASVIQDVSCNGGSNGKATVSVTGGTAPYTYLWNTSPTKTNATVNGIPAGTYTVIVTDKNNCTTSCSVNITQPAPLVLGPLTGTNVSCKNGSDGTASLSTITGGTPPYTYLWNTGTAATTFSVSGLTNGTYKVTVTDDNGCTASATIKITQPTQVTLTATHTNEACGGNSTATITAVANGGAGGYTYTLNPGPVSNGSGVFSGLAAGTYSVTVSDANGCTVSVAGIVITEPATLTMDPTSHTDVTCFGGNNGTATAGVISGGTPPYTYNWNTIPPQGTATATGLIAGTYTVMVTDAHGCTVSGTETVSQPSSQLTIAIIGQTNISCSGGSTGSAEALASGGTAPYSYLWSDGQTTAMATGLTAGSYVVTATDSLGCEASTTVVISQAGAFSVSATSTNVSCHGGSDGTITATVSGGNAPFLYVVGIDTNTTGQFTGLSIGTYTVKVIDVGGCTATTTVQIIEPSQMIANTTSTSVNCNGGTNGTATVQTVGGTPPYSYSWTGGATVQNPTGLAAGTYTVTVTDSKGCTLTRSVIITQPAPLAIIQSQVNVNCNGGSTGTATATVSGGTAPYFYMWSNGQMTQTATGLSAGSYTVTVADYKGCTLTSVYTITTASSIVANPSQGTISCFGGTTTVNVAPTGGNSPYTYSWSQSSLNTTNSAVVGAGTYYVTITDATGCSITNAFIVTQPSQVLCGTSSTNATCNGANNGTASAGASGGVGPYSYLWNGSTTNSSVSGLSPGTYTVIITDANSCTASCSVTITEPSLLVLSLSNSNTSCGTNNGSAMAMVSGGTPPYNYLWDDGETTASISGLSAGTYTVIVSDANGCGPVTASVMIGDTPPVSCSIDGTDATCSGYHDGTATVTVSGGSGSNTYMWNTAPMQTTQTVTGLAAGVYEVIVTDITGCSSTCSIEISEASPLVLSGNQSNSVCSGGSTGSATVNAFGGTPYTVGAAYHYIWSNGQTTQTATGLPAGAVYVTVTDSTNCSATLVIIMQQAPSMSCNTSGTPASCGQANGTATVNVFGGQAPFAYYWNTVPSQSNAIATNVSAGTYTVVVTDANGCSTSCTVTVVQPSTLGYTLAVVNANCNGGMGSVSVTLLNGGTPPYTFVWSNGSSTSSTGLVPAGTYTVTVSDANGCSVIQSATVTAPTALALSTTQVNINCNGNSNGSACVTATGGTQPYTYLWSTGANSQCINNRPAGTYTVTVTDSHGCSSNTNVTITQPAVLDSASTSATPASCGLNNGTGTVNPTGGTPLYSYAWNTTPVQTTQTATGLPAGNNFVTVTDANGCSITVCVKVPSSAGIGLSLDAPVYAGGYNIRCNGATDGSINLTVSGIGPFTYNWSNGATTEDLFGLSAGTYTVTVTNGGCTATSSITLTQAPAMSVTTTQVNVSCFAGNNGSATAHPVGGTPPYTYSWSTSPVKTTKTANNLIAGTYTVTVSDANGCTQTAVITITQPSSGMNITAISTNPTCNGSSDGTIDITVTGGTPPYSYLWTGGAITEDRMNLPAGSHTVTVTDANGCTIQLCVVLTQPTQVTVTTSKTNVSCAGGGNGSASATPAGGTPSYTYQWSNGATTATISNLSSGTYTVTVTDANGCSRSASVSITAPASMVLTTSKTNVTTYGGNDGTASVSVSGGTSPYSYSWNTVPVKTTSSVTGMAAGTYQVTVTDNKGCVQTASVVITQPNYNCSSGTPFRTETPSRWGASSGTAYSYLTANFSAAFPGGLVVGGGCTGSKTLTLSSATSTRNYEVNQSTSGAGTVLSANLVDPTSTTFPSALGANTVALKLNVVFDAYDPNFAPVPTVQLGNMIYNAAPFAGLTVNQVLSEANKKLGGCSSAYTVSQLNTALQNIDSAYKAGTTGPTASFLTCPPPSHLAFTDNAVLTNSGILAYPNPSTGLMNIKFNADQDGKVIVNLMDVTGRMVWNVEENIFIGENLRTYNFSELRKGVYFMQVTKDGQTDIVRIVLQ